MINIICPAIGILPLLPAWRQRWMIGRRGGNCTRRCWCHLLQNCCAIFSIHHFPASLVCSKTHNISIEKTQSLRKTRKLRNSLRNRTWDSRKARANRSFSFFIGCIGFLQLNYNHTGSRSNLLQALAGWLNHHRLMYLYAGMHGKFPSSLLLLT